MNLERNLKIISILLGIYVVILIAQPCLATTTELTITKYASDRITILNQTTKNYSWLAANLPVFGNGFTHYYMQGPVFVDYLSNDATEQELRWNVSENTNCYPDKDMGALKGSNLKDICNLAGGMSQGETVQVKAIDNFSQTFAYKNVYLYSSREGPMIIAWYKGGGSGVGYGYVPGYSDGMRLVWFADTSVNPWGAHVFGNYDWHEAATSEYWYYFVNGNEKYPTTTGLSVQNISQINIYSNIPPPLTPLPLPGKTLAPTDPDNDGVCEDMNGNGIKDFNDLVLYFNQMEWIQANEPVSLFDFNHNGIIDFNDVVRLFQEL
jgi:PKD repeat protein